MDVTLTAILWSGLIFLLHLVTVGRAILRPHRQPASRIAWVVVILSLPLIGIIAYLLLGETNIGQKRTELSRTAIAKIPNPEKLDGWEHPNLKPNDSHEQAFLFNVGRSVNGFGAIAGNQAQLMASSNAAIDAIISDIDLAEKNVHLIFYIWLADNNGLKVVDALKRAANRGITCRAMADGLGSRSLIASAHWKDMQNAGVKLAVALPIGNPLIRAIKGRIDLRNHRKIVVIDNTITYCGSQNCADPEFRVKAKYAPWVDVLMRFEGPIARQNQCLFAGDWMAHVDEDLTEILTEPLQDYPKGFTAQVIGTGPTVRNSAMPEVFENLIYAARKKLFITTPYYVPNEAMQEALCASARRGVDTTIIFPARNDSFIVAAASRSYYEDLLAAGVKIFEYEGGLLHAKTLTFDDQVTLIGSANMDRRSFELNYENNILFHDRSLTQRLYQRQTEFLAQSREVKQEEVRSWPVTTRFYSNLIAMLGPVL